MPYQFDHRQLAGEMEIYCFDNEVGAGLPLWLPRGMAIREELEKFIKARELLAGYQRVASPHIGRSSLYEKSGHLKHFRKNMFPPLRWPEGGSEYFLKPMNCPHHHRVFASSPRSYRALPYRIAEYGQVYRFENSGSLHGLSRVRGLCQNDAHIYVDPLKAKEEIERVLELQESCLKILGLQGYRYRLSKHGKLADLEGGENEWLESEKILRDCLLEKGLDFFEAEEEAAFYGPKIDVQMRLGKGEESVASLQLDFLSGARFGLQFVDSSGSAKCPWVIHRAPLGSHERFVAMLLEYYDGRLPAWLSPVQVYVLPVEEAQAEECRKLAMDLRSAGIRVELSEGSGHLSKRLRLAHRLRPFCLLVVGQEEISSGKLSLQLRQEKKAIWKANLIDELRGLLKVRPAAVQAS